MPLSPGSFCFLIMMPFTLKPDELGCTSTIEQEIHLSNEEPFKEQFRRIPPPLLDEVHASLRDMLEAGAIRPSQSPWCNAVVLVRKKDGSLQFCVDFRRLNAQTKKYSYPLAQNTRSTGKYGRSGTLLHYGLQKWILAGPYGPGVTAVHHLHSWQSRILRSSLGCLLGCVTCTHDIPAFDAKYPGRVEL